MRRCFGRRVDAVQNLRRGRLLHLLEDVRGPVERVLALLPLALLLLEFALGFGPSLADLLELVGFLLGNLLERIRALALVFSMKAISFFAQPFFVAASHTGLLSLDSAKLLSELKSRPCW